jgi:ribonuclease P protein component
MAAPSEKLPRSRIVRRRAIFDATRARGRRTANRWITLSVLPRDPAQAGDASVVAFLTPKRIGGAVVRNRLRRRMREIYRRVVVAPADDVYLIWIARPPAVELALEELRDCMVTLLRRSGHARPETSESAE